MLLSSALLCLVNKMLLKGQIIGKEKRQKLQLRQRHQHRWTDVSGGDSDDEEADGDSDDADDVDDDDDNADEEADDFDDNSDDYDDNADDHLYKSSDPIGLQSLSAEPCRARNGVLH